ncbi:hypothetical protein SAMN06295879_2424 [Agreia bicolorata]|uniref:Uncharacterized protein n=1 Tax=Agreia bicolorata TaxID=110935 RepID=A0A1T4Y7I9_9MICO|nr:hypothetical protein SAMN06295879_2424 [Agreia bicolorata]
MASVAWCESDSANRAASTVITGGRPNFRRRIEDLEERLRASAHSGWKPHEVTQQCAVTVLQNASAPARKMAPISLFGKAVCDQCGEIVQIRRVPTGWDLQSGVPRLTAHTSTCRSFASSSTPHYSVAGSAVWRRRIDEKSLTVTGDTPLPAEQCLDRGCAADCLHTSYRSKPTLPQVIAADPDGVARLVLTDLSGDLSRIFGTSGW